MRAEPALYEQLSSDSFLEYAFLRWVLGPACTTAIVSRIAPQREIVCAERRYFIDYEIAGDQKTFAVELIEPAV